MSKQGKSARGRKRRLERLQAERDALKVILGDVLGEKGVEDFQWLVDLAPMREQLCARLRSYQIRTDLGYCLECGGAGASHLSACSTGQLLRIVGGAYETETQVNEAHFFALSETVDLPVTGPGWFDEGPRMARAMAEDVTIRGVSVMHEIADLHEALEKRSDLEEFLEEKRNDADRKASRK